MGSRQQGEAFLARYGLADVHHFADPDCTLYRAFGLKRAPISAFLTAKVWRRALEGFRAGHGVGLLVGDGLRMPGIFLLHQGRIVRLFRHLSPADRPDYLELCVTSGR